jgi:hypothetical protein
MSRVQDTFLSCVPDSTTVLESGGCHAVYIGEQRRERKMEEGEGGSIELALNLRASIFVL